MLAPGTGVWKIISLQLQTKLKALCSKDPLWTKKVCKFSTTRLNSPAGVRDGQCVTAVKTYLAQQSSHEVAGQCAAMLKM